MTVGNVGGVLALERGGEERGILEGLTSTSSGALEKLYLPALLVAALCRGTGA